MNIKINCVQEPTGGKKFQFLIPSFGPREHCHGYKQSFGTTGFQADEASPWTSSCRIYQKSHLRL